MAELDFLAQIRETEKLAEDIIGQARDLARKRQEEARFAAAERMNAAREEAAAIKRDQLANAETEAADLIAENNAQSRNEAENLSARLANRLETAAAAVKERIVDFDAHR